MPRSLLATGEWVTGRPLRAGGARPTNGAAVMTPGVPGGDGGYADTPTASTVPLAWESPRRRAAAPRPSRLPRWLRRVLITVLAAALACVLAFVALLLVTPSVGTAPSLAQAFDRAHGAAYPGPP